jgi:hypothetical protein
MTRQLPVTPNGSYWKFSGDWELLEVIWSIGVTGSCLVMESYWKLSGDWSYWKLSGHGELLGVVCSLGVTGSFLVIGSYCRQLPVTLYDQITSSNSQ